MFLRGSYLIANITLNAPTQSQPEIGLNRTESLQDAVRPQYSIHGLSLFVTVTFNYLLSSHFLNGCSGVTRFDQNDVYFMALTQEI